MSQRGGTRFDEVVIFLEDQTPFRQSGWEEFYAIILKQCEKEHTVHMKKYGMFVCVFLERGKCLYHGTSTI